MDATSYTYDPSGRITSATDVRNGGGPANIDRQCYTYDYLGRLTNVWTDAAGTHTAESPSVQGIGGCTTTDPAKASFSGPAPYWRSFTYDLTGNRTSSTDHAVPGGATASTTTTHESYAGLPTQHAVHTVSTGDATRTYSYDAAGRPVSVKPTGKGSGSARTLTWTPQDRLGSLVQGASDDPEHSTSYGYDSDGDLIARTTDGTTTLYLAGDTLTLTDGVVSKDVRCYAFPNGLTATRVATATGHEELHWQASDPNGTGTVDVTADKLTVTRRAWTPFGQDRPAGDRGPGWAGDHGFVGGRQDATNQLTNLGARKYDPVLGRFLSHDPDLDKTDTQAMNGYAYADNGPTNHTDPDGRRLACSAAIPCGPVDKDHPHGRYEGDSRYTGPHPTIGWNNGVVHYRRHHRTRHSSDSGRSGGSNTHQPHGRGQQGPKICRIPGLCDTAPMHAGGMPLAPGPLPTKGIFPYICNEHNPGCWAYRHLGVAFTACYVVCLGATFQHGQLSFATGGLGIIGYGPSIQYTSVPPEQQGPITGTACAGDVVAGCVMSGTIAGSHGPTGGPKSWVGGSIGPGEGGFAGAMYTFMTISRDGIHFSKPW